MIAYPPQQAFADEASSVLALPCEATSRLLSKIDAMLSAWSILLISIVVLSGCGGSVYPKIAAISFPNGTVSSVAPGAVTAMSATVTNDSKALGLDWSVTCTPPAGVSSSTANACGSFSPAHTASGAITNFTAPYAIPANGTVTIVATSTTDPTRTAKLQLTIAGAALSITIAPSTANVEINAQASFTATVSNDPANAGVNWTLSCGTDTGSVCGTLQESQSASGVAVTYVAPAVIPASLVLLTATSVTNPTITAQANITVVPAIVVSFFSVPPATLPPSASASLIAVVANDYGNAGVTWSATAGTFSVMQTASGVATIYTAPAGVASGTIVTVTATSVTDPTKSISANITIAFNITVGISTAVTTLPAGSSASFAATVSNDAANAGVRWSATAGTFSTTTTASGVSTTYTAPPSIPAGGIVTISATSVTDSTKVATAPVTITAAAIAVSIAPPSQSVQVSGVVGFVAVVSNDPSNKGVTWTTTGGTVAPQQTASGAATVFTAPTTVPSGGSVTVTASSVADPTKSASAIVTISATALPISVSVSPSTATVAPSATQSFTATVSNDASAGGVTWTSTAGTLSLNQTASGVPTLFTAPSTPPPGGTVTITATSVDDPTKSSTATVTVAAPSNNTLLNGQYAFSMTGQNSLGGPLDTAYETYLGSFTADGNGNITAGEVDFNSSALTSGSMNITGITGTYSLDASGHGVVSLMNSAQSYALNLSVSIVNPNHGLIMSTSDSSDNGVLNGTFDLQTASSFTTPLNGSFAFNFALPFTGGEEPDDLGGVLAVIDGTITNYLLDENHSGQILSSSNPGSDAFGAPDSNGRGLITLNNFGSQSGLNFSYYLIDSTHFLLASTQGGAGLAAAYMQPATPLASLAGSYVFIESAYNAGGSISEQIDAGGILSCDANGNLTSGTVDVNSGGTFTTSVVSGTCALDSTADGRGTITITSGSSGGVSSFAVYPTANNGLVMVDLDTTVAGIGNAYSQASGVSTTTFSGNYAASFDTAGNSEGGATTLLGSLAASGTNSLSGTVDINDFAEAAATLNATLTGVGSLTDTGNGRLTGEFKTSPTSSSSALVYHLQQIFYVVDTNTVLSLESDASPGTGILQLLNLSGSQSGANKPSTRKSGVYQPESRVRQ